MKTRIIQYDDLFKENAHWREPCPDHLGYDILFWSNTEGSHVHGAAACLSSTVFGGTCNCNSHDTWEERRVSVDEAVGILKEWGVHVEGEYNRDALKEDVEQAVFNASPETLLRLAGVLGVEVLPRRSATP